MNMRLREATPLAAVLVAFGHVDPAASLPQQGAAPVTLTYFGAAGWEITDGDIVVLVDPYVSRNAYPSLPEDLLRPDGAVLDALVPEADYIVVHHAHPDHFADVPYIASRTGARVIATRASIAVLRAYGVPERQLVPAVGGEDLQLDGVSIRAIPALHSGRGPEITPVPDNVIAPVRIWSLEQGGTESLMFLIRMAGHEVLTMGSMNYIEREVEGLRPDIALVGASPARRQIYDYTHRLMEALGGPAVVMPTHWDNFYLPYGHPDLAVEAPELGAFTAEVGAASPETRVVIPEHLVGITIGADGEVIGRSRTKPRVEDDLVVMLEPGSGLLSEFEGDEPDASLGMGWIPFYDGIYRGESTSQLAVAEGGAGDSSGSLRVSGTVVGAPNTFAGAMFWAGDRPWGPVDLSEFDQISFWVRGDGRPYRLRVDAQDLPPSGVTQTFDTGPDWRRHTVSLSSFGTDRRYVTAIAFLAGDEEGPFTFQLDDVRLIPAATP
jgi:L-ascorbate metabolism protein UlaG (beta-lactamase superfamily)